MAARLTESVEPMLLSSARPVGGPLLTEGTLLADLGRCTEVIQLLAYPYEHDAGDDLNFSLQAGSLLCEAWAMAGRHDDAQLFAADLELRLEQPGLLDRIVEGVRARLFLVYTVSAMPDKCAAILSSLPVPGMGAGRHSAEERGIAEGLLHIHQGRFDRALATLLPAINRLREASAPGILGLALAECAYCYAVKDEPDEARKFLAELRRGTYEQCWFGEQVTTFLELATTGLLGSPESSARAMIDRAEECGRNDQHSMQLIYLTGAVRLGSLSAIALLVGTAARMQGHYPDLCGDYGLGMAKKDGKHFLNVARAATKSGNHFLARDCARWAATYLDDAGDQISAREARRLIQSIDGGMSNQLPGPGAVALANLTSQEREVLMAALPGATNIEISRKLSMSVKTVESCLYQIYSKLQVTSREDLRAHAVVGSLPQAWRRRPV
ncbi:helix-turn-helix transcriptional regulator [Arthrobacter sp. TMN-50]